MGTELETLQRRSQWLGDAIAKASKAERDAYQGERWDECQYWSSQIRTLKDAQARLKAQAAQV